MLFGAEPTEVRAAIRHDPDFGTDVVTSAILDFDGRHATFTCSTQIEPSQRVELVGTAGRLVVEIPYNIPPDVPTRILHIAGGDPPVSPAMSSTRSRWPTSTASRPTPSRAAIRDGTPVPTAPEDAVANLRVIERILADAVPR